MNRMPDCLFMKILPTFLDRKNENILANGARHQQIVWMDGLCACGLQNTKIYFKS